MKHLLAEAWNTVSSVLFVAMVAGIWLVLIDGIKSCG